MILSIARTKLSLLLATAAIAACSALALPSIASATDYCVGVTPVACPVQTYPATAAGLFSANGAANNTAGADRIFLAAGNYPMTSALALSFLENVQILGAGVDQTIFTSSAPVGGSLGLDFVDATSKMSGFTLNITGTPNNSTGIALLKGRVENFAINEQTTSSNNLKALVLSADSTAENGTIHVSQPTSQGIISANGNATANHLTVSGPGYVGFVISTSGSVKIDHSSISGFDLGIKMDSGTLSMNDTLVDMGAKSNAIGILSLNYNSGISPLNLTLARVSVVGTGANQEALYLGADNGMEEFAGSISDSLIYGSGANFAPITCFQGLDRPVALTVANTAYDPSKSVNYGTCVPVQTATVDLAAAPPTFVGPGDYRPAAGSSLIDAGSTGTGLAVGATDLDGSPRQVSADGNCPAHVDPGAYEFQAPNAVDCEPVVLPPVTSTTSTPDPLPTPTPTPTATAKVSSKPKKSFATGSKGFVSPKSGKAYFTLTYANAKTAKFTMQSITSGKKSNGKCKKGSGKPSCTLYTELKGSATLPAAGTTKYSFGGKFGGKKLKAGKYRVTVTPISSAGAAGKPVTVDIKLK